MNIKHSHIIIISFLFLFILPKYIHLQTIQGTPSHVPWKYTNIDAIDISLSPSGSLYIIGTDSLIYTLNPHTLTFTPLPIQPPSPPLTISLYNNNIPFITTSCNKIYFLSPSLPFPQWIQLPGCATHLSISSSHIWKTGCDSSFKPLQTYEISYLTCNNRELLTSHIKDSSIELVQIENELKQNCEWISIEGEALSIAAVDNEVLYGIVYNGNVMKYINGTWMNIYNGKAIDIDVSNEGVLFVVDNEGNVLRNLSEELDTWMILEGRARKISVGLYALPVIVSWIGNHVKISFT